MRVVSRLAITAVILVVVLLLVDTAARWATQSRLASTIQQTQSLATTPTVSIGGMPFLTQAIRGRYDHVSVVTGVVGDTKGLSLTSVDADLRGVHLPVSAAINGPGGTVPVDSVDAKGVVSFDSLAATITSALGGQVSGVQVSRSAGGGVQVKGTYSIAGVSVPLSAPLTVVLAGNRLTVAVAASGLSEVPVAFRTAVAQALTAQVTIPKLPYGLHVTGVTVTSDGVAVTASATNVTLRAG